MAIGIILYTEVAIYQKVSEIPIVPGLLFLILKGVKNVIFRGTESICSNSYAVLYETLQL